MAPGRVGEDDGRRQSGDRRGDRDGRVGTPGSGRRGRGGARGAEGPWGQMSARERGRLVGSSASGCSSSTDEVARLETLHNGKPISESRHIEIPAAADASSITVAGRTR